VTGLAEEDYSLSLDEVRVQRKSPVAVSRGTRKCIGRNVEERIERAFGMGGSGCSGCGMSWNMRRRGEELVVRCKVRATMCAATECFRKFASGAVRVEEKELWDGFA